jgi:hypothetical protein
MLEALRNVGILPTQDDDQDDAPDDSVFGALRVLAAQLLFTTGVSTTLHHLQQRTRGDAADEFESPATGSGTVPLRRPEAAIWAPLLLGTAAAAAHVAHTVRPSEKTLAAMRILNGAVVGVGVAELGDTLYASARRERPFSTASLVFGSAGVLGFLLDRGESEIEAEREQLERRARIVERFVPRRRPKLEKVVVHV